MSRNIPRAILPDLMKYMMEMGHSDTLIIKVCAGDARKVAAFLKAGT